MSREVYGKHLEELTSTEMVHLDELIALAMLESDEIKEKTHSHSR